MKPNRGHCPREAEGKRVKVRLANGTLSEQPWPADGKGGCRWTLTGHPYDIAEYQVVA